MVYDKNKDPNRVNEAAVRRAIAEIHEQGGFPDGFSLIQQGAFSPGGDGLYAAVRCITLQEDAPFEDRPYCLHDVVLMSEAAGIRGVLLIRGSYDLTMEQAAAAL